MARSPFLFLFSLLLLGILVPAPRGYAAPSVQGTACVQARVFAHFPSGLAAKTSILLSESQRLSLLEQFHIRQIPGTPGYEVLVPSGAETWMVVKARSYDDALRLAKASVSTPLNFDADLKYAPLVLERLQRELAPIQKKYNAQVLTRVKDPESLKTKIFSRSKNATLNSAASFKVSDIRDLAGKRIVVNNWEQVSQVAQEISEKLKSIKYSSSITRGFDASGGYQAIHIAGQAAERIPFEIQIMTKRMRLWHEWDHASVYKPRVAHDEQYLKRLKRYSKEMGDYVYARDMKNQVDLPKTEGIKSEDLFPLQRLQQLESELRTTRSAASSYSFK